MPEFLLHFPTLVRLLEEQGLELVFKKSFAEYSSEKLAKGEGRHLIGKMKGLEGWPGGEKVRNHLHV